MHIYRVENDISNYTQDGALSVIITGDESYSHTNKNIGYTVIDDHAFATKICLSKKQLKSIRAYGGCEYIRYAQDMKNEKSRYCLYKEMAGSGSKLYMR